MTCQKCNNKFSCKVKIGDKYHNLCSRKFCLTCSPFKAGNRRDLTKPHTALINSGRNYSKFTKEEKQEYNKKSYKIQRPRRIGRKIILIERGGGKCIFCGYSKNIAALNFHHTDSKVKKFEICSAFLSSKPFAELEEEAAKCVVMCNRCHVELHNPQLEFSEKDLTRIKKETIL